MSIASILQDLESYVIADVKQAEVAAASWWKGFEPILESDFQAFVTAIKPIAVNLVVALAETALSGPAKLATVSAALVATAEAQGLKATTTMANTVVQQVVASIGMAKAP